MSRFLQVDQNLWRGPQPTASDLWQLKSQGLKAVFNLRLEARHSRAIALEAGPAAEA